MMGNLKAYSGWVRPMYKVLSCLSPVFLSNLQLCYQMKGIKKTQNNNKYTMEEKICPANKPYHPLIEGFQGNVS